MRSGQRSHTHAHKCTGFISSRCKKRGGVVATCLPLRVPWAILGAKGVYYGRYV